MIEIASSKNSERIISIFSIGGLSSMLGKVICIGKFSSREEINSVFFKSEKEVTIIVSNGLSPFSPIREKKLFWIQSKMIFWQYVESLSIPSR